MRVRRRKLSPVVYDGLVRPGDGGKAGTSLRQTFVTAAYWNTAATLLSHLHSSRPFRNEHGGMDAIFATHLSFLFATID
jgi:hypothetical protein